MDKDILLLALNEKWRCSIPFGWIPITNNEIVHNTEIYKSDYLAYYIEEIKAIIKNSYKTTVLFEIREDGLFKELDITDCDFCYDGLEYIYTNIELNFVLYFSHENSTTIGGKTLLEEIQKIWPEHYNHLWKPL